MNRISWIAPYVFCIGFALISGPARSQPADCGKATILFANGILQNSPAMAKPTVDALRTALNARVSQLPTAERQQIPPFDVQLTFVPSAGSYFGDMMASFDQNVKLILGDPSTIDILALGHIQNYYLPAIFRGRRVVTVAHSYGNYYVNQSVARLASMGYQESIGVMAVANPTIPAPINNYDYATLSTDTLINHLLTDPVWKYLATPLLPNVDPVSNVLLGQYNHEFVEAYLGDANARKRVIDGVIARLKATKAPAKCSVTSVIQPGPATGKDIWTTDTYSFAPGGGGPGGGLNDDTLRVGGWYDEYRSLLQFDVSSSTLPQQPKSVVLRLFDGTAQGQGTTPMTLWQITRFWDWTTQPITPQSPDQLRLWWVNQPPAVQLAATSSRSLVLAAPTAGQSYDIDITDLYLFWKANPSQNFGLELRPTDTVNKWNIFYSSDYLTDPSKRPQLIITP